MCVGDERPVTSSLREYVCIWAPMVEQTDVQIRMINCTDLNLPIVTLAAYLKGPVTHSLSPLVKSCAKCRVLLPILAYLMYKNKENIKKVRPEINEREAERSTLREWGWQRGELRHCLAESPVISRSWTCRNCWPGWRSGVHTITVSPTGGISTGGWSTLWPPTLLTHPSTARPHSSHTLNIGLSMLLTLPLFQSTFGWNVSLRPEQKLSMCQ